MPKILLFLCLFLAPLALQARPVTVFAASSLTNAIEEINRLYQTRYQQKVVASFAASSALARQIASGAPADVFISANSRWMDFLAQQQAVQASSITPLLQNSLVLIASKFYPSNSATKLTSLADKLGDQRLAIANPEHVPAGIYARQALESSGQWSRLKTRLALGQNVRSTLLLVERGEAPFGIVYNTDALQSRQVSTIEQIPVSLHQAIVYPAALIKPPSAEVAHYYQFLFSDAAQAIFSRYGFQPLVSEFSDAQ
ncbi:molybdate ABC transporter substrate-binding protein [Amphritea sp. 1_MG-2023]|uniref:molybdate ABC transporter substrate-binding protein n=1 Tax=Amphritea sp. 1_MG-2023 TaxID=3062670 RepID=UPI0026E35165|nr:molybdate ABC transporter substrate-binding protein [Amphritea sp. 1_MG-2023]MDO6562177.1 molybdate ABC transporter substrate-binding protein [Amphritea sp. 1_MG-2023]